MAENTKTQPKPEPLVSWMDSTAAKLAGAAAAVGFTFATASHAISQAFFKNMNKAQAFTDLQNTRDKAIEHIIVPAVKHEEMINSVPEVAKINRIYEKQLAGRMKNLGFNNIVDKFQSLKRHQVMEVAFATSAVAGLAVGAIATIASNRDVLRKQDEIENLERDIDKHVQGRS